MTSRSLVVLSTVVLVLVGLAAPARASLAVALVTADRVVVASDSRTWDPRCDCAAGDTARKVDVRGTDVVAMTGWPGVFHAWTATPARPGETAQALATRILAAARPDPARQTATILIVRYGPRVDAYAARVAVDPDGAVTILEAARPAVPFAVALGWARDGGGQTGQHEARGHAQAKPVRRGNFPFGSFASGGSRRAVG